MNWEQILLKNCHHDYCAEFGDTCLYSFVDFHILRYVARQSSLRLEEAEKRRFMQSVAPLGEPDLEDGFRRIATPAYVRAHRRACSSASTSAHTPTPTRRQLERRVKSGSARLRRSNTSASDRNCHQGASDVSSLSADLTLLGLGERDFNCSEDAFQGSLKSFRTQYGRPKASLERRASSGTTRIKDPAPDPDPRALTAKSFVSKSMQCLDTNGLRSSSNAMLNVYTIDDALRQLGHGSLQDKDILTSRQDFHSVQGALDESSSTLGNSAEESKIETTRGSTPRSKTSRVASAKQRPMGSIVEESKDGHILERPASSASSKKSSHDHMCCQHSSAVKTAFRTLTNSKEVVNDKRLYRGLIETEENRPRSAKHADTAAAKQESQNFRRLNRNLRTSLTNYYASGSALSRKIDQWYGRPSSAEHCPATSTPRSRGSAGAGRGGEGGAKHRLATDYRKQRLVASHPVHADNHEHFLKVLMDIEDGLEETPLYTYV